MTRRAPQEPTGVQEVSFAMNVRQASTLLLVRQSAIAACRRNMPPILAQLSAVNASAVDSAPHQKPPPVTCATRGSTQLLVAVAAACARAGSTAMSERRRNAILVLIVWRENGVVVGPGSVRIVRPVNTPELRQTFASHAKVGSSAERAHHRARRRVLRVVMLEWELQLVKIALVELTLLRELQFA